MILTRYTSDRGLISRMYKEIKKKSKAMNGPFEKKNGPGTRADLKRRTKRD